MRPKRATKRRQPERSKPKPLQLAPGSGRSSRGIPGARGPRPAIANNVLEAIGYTPMIRLNHFTDDSGPNCFVKFEALNPAGSSKDRSAAEIVEAAEQDGTLKPGGTIIISTSGNMGVALALVCAVKKYQLFALVDPKIAPTNESLLGLYGAKVIKVWKRDSQGGYHLTRMEKATEIQKKYPNALYIDQYDCAANVQAHYRTTAPEIAEALNGKVDAVLLAAGTGGTLMGHARYFKEHFPKTHIWAVDEHGSLALPANTIPQLRFLNGMGTGIRPNNYDYPNLGKLLDKQHYVSAGQAIQAAVDLARTEGILTGGSGGAVAFVMRHVMTKAYHRGQNIVGLLPDHGSRYTDTFFDKKWLALREIEVTGL